jgi:hypothetical protein
MSIVSLPNLVNAISHCLEFSVQCVRVVSAIGKVMR